MLEEWHGRPSGPRRTAWFALEALRLALRYLFVRRRLPGVDVASGRHGPGRPGRERHLVDGVAGDLTHGLRALRRQVTFTATSVTVLALGIGAATAACAAFQTVVLEELPVTEPDRLVHFSLQARTGAAVGLTAEKLGTLARRSRTLEAVAGVAGFGAAAIPLTEDGRPLVLSMSSVTPSFFEVLGARPVLGRLLRPEDGEEGAAPVAVIAHETWRRDFGGDPQVMGRRLTLTQYRTSYAIVGVAPPGLDHPAGVGYWIPSRSREVMDVVARLAPEVTPDAARSEFLALAAALDARQPGPRSPDVATVRSLRDAVLGDAKPILLAITIAVAFLLAIACANVGSLLLMRATRRAREVVVRRALGASSAGVARLFLVESVLLGAAGGGLGLALATGLLHLLPRLAPDRLPRSETIALAGPPVAVAVAVSVVAVLLFGVGPAIVAAHGDLASALRGDARPGSGTRDRRRVRRSLAAIQLAVAVVLLFGAGLVLRSFQRLQGLDLGYDTERVAVVELGLDGQTRGWETIALLEGALGRLREVPGVSAATLVMSRPFMGTTGIVTARPMREGQTEAEAESNPWTPLEVGGRELFRTLGIPVVRGRGLLETDREDAPKVVVVSQATAERLWPGEDPIGRRIRLVTSRPRWWTVVGVAGDTRFRRLREPTPTIYAHYRQLQVIPAVWTVAVRTNEDLASVLPAMRRVVHDADGRIEVWRAGTLHDHLARGPLAQPRMSAALLSAFGLAALLLAAFGLYGVVALSVRERTHELGVRRALGASASRLRRDVLGDALATTAVGTLAGLAATLLLSRLFAPLLFEIGPRDPVTAAGVCATLFAVALLAAYLPARRATRVDPMGALRAD